MGIGVCEIGSLKYFENEFDFSLFDDIDKNNPRKISTKNTKTRKTDNSLNSGNIINKEKNDFPFDELLEENDKKNESDLEIYEKKAFIRIHKNLNEEKGEKAEYYKYNKSKILTKDEGILNREKDLKNRIIISKFHSNSNFVRNNNNDNNNNYKKNNLKNQQYFNFENSSLDNYFHYKKNININFNIIYLIDTTSSMKKYEVFIYLLPKINNYLMKKFINMKIGYVLYKDFENYKEYDPNKYIKIFLPSKLNIDIPKDLEFSGGNDFSEDWANSINKIYELTEKNEENIVIHICDSNAHGAKFSDYDTNNNEEIILIKALEQCKTKNIKFVGVLIDDFARKSFLECKKLYNEINGFYDIIDLTKEINNKLFTSSIIEKIINIINDNNIIIQKDWNKNYFLDIDESNFEFNELFVEMKPLYDIDEYKGKKIYFFA